MFTIVKYINNINIYNLKQLTLINKWWYENIYNYIIDHNGSIKYDHDFAKLFPISNNSLIFNFKKITLISPDLEEIDNLNKFRNVSTLIMKQCMHNIINTNKLINGFPNTIKKIKLKSHSCSPSYVDNTLLCIEKSLTHLIIGDDFDNLIYVPKSVTHLKLGYNFNQPINIPYSVTHLEIGGRYSKPLDLPKNITYLRLGHVIDYKNSTDRYMERHEPYLAQHILSQQIFIPDTVTYLYFTNCYFKLMNIPKNIIYLTTRYNHDMTIIPDTITHLTLIGKNNIISLSNSITHLIFDNLFNRQILLPTSIIHLTFGSYYDQETIIPPLVTHLIFGRLYNKPTVLHDGIIFLEFGNRYNRSTNLPNSLKHLIFGSGYYRKTILPSSITHVTFGNCFNYEVNIPNSVTHLTFGGKYNMHTIVPNSVTHLTFGNEYNQDTLIPKSVKYLKFGHDFNKTINVDYTNGLPNISEIYVHTNYNKNIDYRLKQFIKYEN